jgi:peptidoglycan/xylan/chitin deacetylase (PgdA/CDA1 family)
MKTAYLTIDDGPSGEMGAKLDLLDSLDVPAVWFCLGAGISERLEVVVDAIRRGHVVGNHSWSHPHFSEIGVDDAQREISSTDALIDEVYDRAGVPRERRWFRFPYGDRGSAELQPLLRRLGFAAPPPPLDGDGVDWLWTFDTNDWQETASARAILARFDTEVGAATAGPADASPAVVLVHDHDGRLDLFEGIVAGLVSRGVHFGLPG